MELVEIGLFKLPGVKFEKEDLTPELQQKITEWANSEFGYGFTFNNNVWSFRNEKQRDMFILKFGK